MMNISLLRLRKASKPYEIEEKMPIRTPNIITPWRKAQRMALAPMDMV